MKDVGTSRSAWLSLGALALVFAVTGAEARAQEEQTPPKEAEALGVVVYSKLIDGEVPVDDPDAAVWNEAPVAEFPLSAQVHWEPRIFTVSVTSIKVQSVHNGERIAFRTSYKDTSEGPGDAAALEFMVGGTKAHFAHGQPMAQVEGGPVNIWHWKSETSDVTDLTAKGFGTLAPHASQDVKGKGVWKNGEWSVVFSRAMRNDDELDTQFEPGRFESIAFAVWNSGNNERGAMKAVSSWWYLRPEPAADPKIFLFTGAAVIVVALIEIVIVRNLRRKGEGE